MEGLLPFTSLFLDSDGGVIRGPVHTLWPYAAVLDDIKEAART